MGESARTAGGLLEHRRRGLVLRTCLPLEIIVAPALWAEFCTHGWRDPKTMMRVFELASDVAMNSQMCCGAGIRPDSWAAVVGRTVCL
jgi:hypothetical protein